MRLRLLMSLLVVLSIISLHVNGRPRQQGKDSLRAPYDRVYVPLDLESVVLLELENGGRCTGWIIDEGYLATAAHCTQDSPDVSAVLPAGPETFHLVFQGVPATKDDVSILQGNTHGLHPFRVAKKNARPGSMCFVSGHGGTQDEFFIPCFMMRENSEGLREAIAAVRPGDSGGPVFGMNLEVVGMAVAMSLIFENQSFFVEAETISHALEQAKTHPIGK